MEATYYEGGPGILHEWRRELLDNLAMLAGYDRSFDGCLPDGTRPDVLRFDTKCGSIFLGEAKDTESPSCAETFKRLSNYMNWFRLVTRKQRGSTFVICFGEEPQAAGWQDILHRLSVKVGFVDFRVEYSKIGDDAFFVSLKL